MKNLGRILVFLLLLNRLLLHADVRATVDSTIVELGDMVTYSLHLNGEKIVRPNIQTLCGEDVISTSSQTSIEMINGEYSKTYTLSYKFVPQEDCKIEPVEVIVDGKVQQSNSVEIKVVKNTNTKDKDFVLELHSSKQEVYVGEPFELTLLLKQRIDAEAVDSKFEAPKLNGFWIKSESQPLRSQDGKYVITKIAYKIAAQRVGDLNISKAKIQIAKRASIHDIWGGWMPQVKWKTYYSNTLQVSVKPLPNGVDIVGNFKIYADVKKREIEQSEALNLEVKVVGNGNLEDIKSFKPYINGVNVFDEKIVIKDDTLTQKMAFVADSDFTIPSFKLKFFNPETEKIETIQTKPVYIRVKNSKPHKQLKIKRDENSGNLETVGDKSVTSDSNGVSVVWLGIVFLLGFICAVVFMIYKPWEKYMKRDKKLSIKDPKVLLLKLIPYKEDESAKEIIEILEKNIYEGTDINIDKQLLRKVLKRYNIKK